MNQNGEFNMKTNLNVFDKIDKSKDLTPAGKWYVTAIVLLVIAMPITYGIALILSKIPR